MQFVGSGDIMSTYILHIFFIVFRQKITSPIYRTCSLNSRKCGVPCQCHSQQMLNSVFRVLSIPYTLALISQSFLTTMPILRAQTTFYTVVWAQKCSYQLLHLPDSHCFWQPSAKIVLPKFGSEPKFEPEPLGPNSKFSSRFRIFAELNLRSSSKFSQS